jgi:solute carrier family 25 protein 34/35
MSACLFTNPSEVIKTRLQVQNELGRAAAAVYAAGPSANAAAAAAAANAGPPPPKLYKNVFHAFYVVARTEGLRGLQGGLGPSLLYQLTMNGTRLGMYEPLKRLVTRAAAGDFDGSKGSDREPRLGDHARAHRPPVFWHNVVAAASSGMIAAFIGSPFFLVKVRLQIQSKQAAAAPLLSAAAHTPGAAVLPAATAAALPTAVGAQHAYTSAFGGLRSIYRADGITGLWRGCTASMLRVSVGSTVQLSTYDHCKFWIMQRTGWADSAKVHLSASLLSGALVTLAMNPPDVISTRLYNQPVVNGKGTLYSGLVDCAAKTIRTEGIAGLYKGTTAVSFAWQAFTSCVSFGQVSNCVTLSRSFAHGLLFSFFFCSFCLALAVFTHSTTSVWALTRCSPFSFGRRSRRWPRKRASEKKAPFCAAQA